MFIKLTRLNGGSVFIQTASILSFREIMPCDPPNRTHNTLVDYDEYDEYESVPGTSEMRRKTELTGTSILVSTNSSIGFVEILVKESADLVAEYLAGKSEPPSVAKRRPNQRRTAERRLKR